MQYDEFVEAVRRETGVERRDQAEEAAFVVLRALAERISGGEADDLYAQLPDPLKTKLVAHVDQTRPARSMPANDFVARVADELGVDDGVAEDVIRGVFEVVRQAVTPGELDDVLAQLDSSYRALVAPHTA